jgi:hypothetical protein
MDIHEKLSKLKNRKILSIIVIIVVITSIFTWYVIENSKSLEFSIKLEEDSNNLTNKSIYYQFKNIDDKIFTYLAPEIGKNLDFIIKAKNGTEYHYAGPTTYGHPWWKSMSPGEIEYGTNDFGSITSYSNGFEFDYTHWQNSDTGEYWFFQPGTYKIYGKYESEPNNDYENVLVGTWNSNVVTLTIE